MVGCSATSGPDKSAAGAILGAGWGATGGAVIGNQIGHSPQGIAVGSAIGAVGGLVTGIGLDVQEGSELRAERELDALKVRVSANERAIKTMQLGLDEGTNTNNLYLREELFFDEGRSSIKLGNAEKLQKFSESVKMDPTAKLVEIHGHADSGGEGVGNDISLSRAKTVAAFMISQGISSDQIKIFSHGADNAVGGADSLRRRVNIFVKR